MADSPCVLTTSEYGWSANMERISALFGTACCLQEPLLFLSVPLSPSLCLCRCFCLPIPLSLRLSLSQSLSHSLCVYVSAAPFSNFN